MHEVMVKGREGKGREGSTDRQVYGEKLEVGSSFLDHKAMVSHGRSWSLYIHSAGGTQTGYELGWQAGGLGQKVIL